MIAIVVQAVVRVSRRALTHPALIAIAVAAYLALTFFAVSLPLVILAAGGARLDPQPPLAEPGRHTGREGQRRWAGAADPRRPAQRRATQPPPDPGILTVGLTAWTLPIIGVGLAFDWDSIFVDQALFFSGAAVITFGGAYAVLAYVAQHAVAAGWLLSGEMVRGLALAETTPGPLIMVVQFVAFVGAYRTAGDLNPWAAATLAALLTTWVTFVPCFLFVFLGAPCVERLRHNHGLTAALTGITAAVVGVIASLANYFTLHTLFTATQRWQWGIVHLELPQPGSLSLPALAITAIACVLIFALKWCVLRTLGVCAILGIAAQLILLR